MRRMFALVVALVMLAAVPATASPKKHGHDHRHRRPFPTAIPLPDGFFPEGITIAGRTAYVGSLVDGAIQKQNLRTGRSRQFGARTSNTSPGSNSSSRKRRIVSRGVVSAI